MLRQISRPILSRVRMGAAQRWAHKATVVVERELPPAPSPSRKSWYIGGAIVGTALWVAGIGAAMNYQRLTSSVVTGTLFMVRYDPRVIELIGDKVDYADEWAWITGTVNHLKGQVCIAFDVTGSTGERGRVRFSSVRKDNVWRTLEFTVTRESDGKLIDLSDHPLTEMGSPAAGHTQP